MRILFVHEQGIGNMIQATPGLMALHRLYPAAKIDVLGKKPAIDILQDFDAINETITEADLDKVEKDYDLALCSIWSDGFIKNHNDWLKKRSKQLLRMQVQRWEEHESQYHFDMAKKLGYTGDKPDSYCYVKEWDIDIPKPYIILGDTSLPNWEKKRWRHYPELAEKLIEDGYTPVFIGGEYEAVRFVKEDYPESVHTYFNKPIGELAYLIQQAEFFVGNDSGPAHISGAVGQKTFAIFGPTTEMKNKPLGDDVHIISLDYHCRPCQFQGWENVCQENECLQKLSSESVYHQITRILSTVKVPPEYDFKVTFDLKLVCFMRIKDALSRHTEEIFRESLDKISEFADEIIVVDNGSTDGTLEIYEEYPQITKVAPTEGFDEGRDKILGTKLAKEHGADWIFCIDADHVPETRFTKEKVQEMMANNEVSCYWFRTVQFWRNKQEYRVDMRWKPGYELAMFRNTPESGFLPQKIHGGPQNIKGKHEYSDMAIKHFGHVRRELTKQKRDLYVKVDDSGRSYEHMEGEEGVELAIWRDDPAERDLGRPSLLIVMMHGAGDQFWLTPTVRQLKQNNPDLILGLLVLPMHYNKEVWQGNPYVDHLLVSSIDHHPTYWDATIFNEQDKPVIDKDIGEIQEKHKFDKIIFVTLQENKHLSRISRLAMQLGVKLDSTKMDVFPTDEDKQAAKEFLDQCGITLNDFVVTLQRGAGNPPKQWNFDECEKLAKQLVELGAKVIMLDPDPNETQHVEGEYIYSVRNIPELSMQITAEIIRLSSLHIGTDSMPIRLAAAVGTPYLNLFKVSWMHQSDDHCVNSVNVCTPTAYKMASEQWLNENKEKVVVGGNVIRAIDVLRGIKALAAKGFVNIEIPDELLTEKDPANKLWDGNSIADPTVNPIMTEMGNLFGNLKRKHSDTKLYFNPSKWFRFASFFKFAQPKPGATILDVGSGLSIWPFYLAVKDFKVSCIDSETGDDLADEVLLTQMPIYVSSDDILENNFAKNHFDYITSLSVLEHIEQDTEALLEMATLLKPGGIIAITVVYHPQYIPYPDADRTLVTDKKEGHCNSRSYNKEALYERLIEPAKEAGLELYGEVDFENVDATKPENRAVRGLYTHARLFLRKAE